MNEWIFFEIDGRAVAVDFAHRRAFAHCEDGHWRERPALVARAGTESLPLTLQEMSDEFPEADPKFLPVTPS